MKGEMDYLICNKDLGYRIGFVRIQKVTMKTVKLN